MRAVPKNGWTKENLNSENHAGNSSCGCILRFDCCKVGKRRNMGGVHCQQPILCQGDSNHLTPLQLETLLTEGNTSRFWLVEFRALSMSSCIRTTSFFPELSITYSNKNLSFGSVDLGLFPNAAEKFGISLGNLRQLPAFILFENGTEVSCLSEMNFGAKVFGSSLTKCNPTKKNCSKYKWS